MKKLFTIGIFLLISNLCLSQEWMTSLDFARKLALDQNKMILMVWEDTTYYPYPVLLNDSTGRTILVKDLFSNEDLYSNVWKYFVPVIVNESEYDDWYNSLKGNRSQAYMDVFNDDSIKILDTNCNILNLKQPLERLQNLSDIISKYALNTKYISKELRAYSTTNDFYATYYLASKYLDYAIFHNSKTREALVKLSHIYSNEALILAENSQDKVVCVERCNLLQIQEKLLLKRPKQALRQLNRLNKNGLNDANKSIYAFIAFVAHSSLNDMEKAQIWQSEISSVNLKKAQLIINLIKS